MICLVSIGLLGCTTMPWGKDQAKKGAVKPDATSVAQYSEAMRNKERNLADKLAAAEQAMNAGRLDEADAALKGALAIDPQNDRAKDGLATVIRMRRHVGLMAEAQKGLEKGDARLAEQRVREVLMENPNNAAALAIFAALQKQKDDAKKAVPILKPKGGPVSFGFKEAPVKSVFEALSRSTGVNFIMDKDIPARQTVTIYIMSGNFPDVLDSLLSSNQLQKKIINENTVLVYPNTPAKVREYQEQELRSFYLANADVKLVGASLKSMLDINNMQIDERANLIILRETPEVIKMAERMIFSLDVADPEVTLDVQVLEVTSSKLSELGITWPTQLSVVNGTSTTLPLAEFIGRGSKVPLKAENYVVSPLPKATLAASDTDINTIANPSIRVKSREKAKIHVGDRIPLITNTTTTTAASVTTATIQYINVGLSLEVAPVVNVDDEVTMQVSLEVSSLGEKTTTATAEAYRVSTRNAMTTLKLKDGETQILAGLIKDEERNGTVKVPGLGEIPLLGRLFSTQKAERGKTEVLLVITPHVVRNYPSTQSATEADMLLGAPASMGRPTSADGNAGGGNTMPMLPPTLVPFMNPGAVAPKQTAPAAAPAATAAPTAPAASTAPTTPASGIPGLPN